MISSVYTETEDILPRISFKAGGLSWQWSLKTGLTGFFNRCPLVRGGFSGEVSLVHKFDWTTCRTAYMWVVLAVRIKRYLIGKETD